MKSLLGLSYPEMQRAFEDWNRSKLDSYLIEITSHIMAYTEADGVPLVERILDTAGQKGTGRWAAITALETGTPLTLVTEAVLARYLSDMKDERLAASRVLCGLEVNFDGDKNTFLMRIRDALYASKIISYAQGFMLMRAAAQDYGWNLNYGGVALMWRGGCIIRSVFLGEIKQAYVRNPDLANLLFDAYFQGEVDSAQPGWRETVAQAARAGIPTPAMSSALAFYDGLRHDRLPANLIQAQRDYFGAHTYERTDQPRGQFFHTNWTGSGGDVTATSYSA
jgi:6-phosphogluconate dehydrogenase